MSILSMTSQVLDQTDIAPDDSSDPGPSDDGGFVANLSDLALSSIKSIVGSASEATSRVVSQAINPSPDLAAKAATPGGSILHAAGAVSPSVILIGGAILALVVWKMR